MQNLQVLSWIRNSKRQHTNIWMYRLSWKLSKWVRQRFQNTESFMMETSINFARYTLTEQILNGKFHFLCSVHKTFLVRFWNTKPRTVSWFIRASWYTTIGRCIWKLLKQAHKNLWAWFCLFFPTLRLAWQACLKKTEVKLELLTDVDILLRVEKGIRGGMCHAINWYARTNNNYMKDYDPNKEFSYLMYWD